MLPPPKSASRRIVPIDATRGTIMLFSCLAHFAWWIHASNPDMSSTLAAIGMVATPTFLMISGAMVGMLCAKAARANRDLRSQLFNRGLFLLSVGHVLIALAEAHVGGGFLHKLRGITVVDEIGLCTVVASLFVRQLGRRELCQTLALLAILALAAAWLGNVFWMPADQHVAILERTLIGGNVVHLDHAAHSPVLQHVAIYLIGLPVGHYFARSVDERLPAQLVSRRFFAVGSALIVTAMALRAFRHFYGTFTGIHASALEMTLRITEKTPPSPGYLLFFGGCGALIVALMFHASGRNSRASSAMLEWLAVIGRASLIVFILQYFLFWTLPDLLGIQPNEYAALVFFANVLLIRLFAGVWGYWRGNQWLTLGITLPQGRPLER